MTSWIARPREEAHLLNPAFCCLGITAAAVGYQSIAKRGLPLPLAYMILPITLHKPTRELLPRSRRTSLPSWIQDNARVRVLFYERLLSLKPFTSESILFGSRKGWFNLRNDASLVAAWTEAAIQKEYKVLDDEPKECATKALFVGKWLAAAGPPATVMALWGIQP